MNTIKNKIFLIFAIIFAFCVNVNAAAKRSTGASRRPACEVFKKAKPVESAPVECTKEHVEDEAADAFKKLFLGADRELDFANYENHHDEFCNASLRDIEIYEKHAKCLKKGSHAKIFERVAKGFRKTYEHRCNNKEWHDKYVNYSKCMRSPRVNHLLSICGDKHYAQMKAILRRVPEDHQAKIFCCTIPFKNECMANQTVQICGRDAAQFMITAMFEPFKDGIDYLCQNKYLEHCAKYPRLLKEFRRINVLEKLPHHGSQYKLLYQIMYHPYEED